VGTYSAWESTATLRLLGGARQGRGGRGHIVSPRAQLVVATCWRSGNGDGRGSAHSTKEGGTLNRILHHI